jgi:hypothetical protein
MPQPKKCDLKIRMTEAERTRHHAMARACGFGDTSKFILACVEAWPFDRHLDVSQGIIRTFERLWEYETNPKYADLSKKDRRNLVAKVCGSLLTLCRDLDER